MKRYSYKTRELREADNGIIRFKEEMDALITSEEFINVFRVYIEDIALYKSSAGIKYRRSTEYAAIGILDQNDLLQEAYLAFLEAYSAFKDKPESDFDDGSDIWAFLKKSTILNFEYALRNKKDGIRLTQHATFKSGSNNINTLTSIFGKLDEIFSKNAAEVISSKWETDFVGYFLEAHMDDYLDLTRTGKRDVFKKERAILKSVYGIDQVKMTYAEISDEMGVSQSTIRSVKERAIKRLKSEDSKEKIAHFLHEYRITTNADTEKYRE